MILPSTYLFSILLLVLGMICSGLWVSTFKAAGGKWRFELYYFDFSLGVIFAALLAAFTLGSLGWDGFSFIDDIRNAGKRQEVYGFLAGFLINLGNLMMLAGISLTGIAIAFPIALGMAIVVSGLWSLILTPGSANLLLLGAGAFCLVATTAVACMAFKANVINQLAALIQQGKTKSTKKNFSAKGLALAIAGGVLMGSNTPLLDLARDNDIGLGPYGLIGVVAIGVVLSTFVYNLFFMNLPVQGKVLDFGEYFKGNIKAHYMGILGGMLWVSAILARVVVAKADPIAQVPAAISFALSEGGILVGTLSGLLLWKEFSDADSKVKGLLTSMLVLLVVGVALVTVAPIYNVK